MVIAGDASVMNMNKRLFRRGVILIQSVVRFAKRQLTFPEAVSN